MGMALRYVGAFFLIVLLLLILGVITGYLSLDVKAPLDRQLTASSALALQWVCDDDYGECYWVGDTNEGPYYVEEEEIYYPGGGGSPYVTTVEEEIWYGSERPPLTDDGENEDIYIVDEWTMPAERGEVEEWIEWEEPSFGKGGWYDEWTVEDEYWFDEPRAAQNSQTPWYVSAFPGIGKMVQQIVPGLNQPAPRPAPPRPVYPQPSCWISALGSEVEYGGSSTLSWSSFNATRASITDVGTVPLSGSRLLQNIRSDRTYQLTVSGAGGTGSCYTRITVRPQSAAPACVIAAYPNSIHVGQSANLAWGSDRATSAYLSGVGTVPPQGGRYVSPTKTTTYTLTVTGPQGSSTSCSAQIGVLP